MNSEELFQRALKVAPGGVHSPVRSFKGLDRAPVFFKEAQGAFLTSVENKKYIDFCQSFGPLILGHRDPDVAEEVHRMVDTAWTFGATEIYSLELAEWITSTLPFMEKLRFVSSGTEAVMSALRVARAATGRHKILKFEGCYHGHVDSLLVKAGSGLAGISASSSAGISAEVAALTLVTPLDDEEKLAEVFHNHGHEIAAVIIEPLPANYGLLVQRPEFLQKVAALCKANNSLLIFDEVISGFRVGLGGMVEKTGIQPDLVTYGKIIGGGFPVGCYGGKAELMNLVAPSGDVYQAGTLSANPIGMRAGLTTLKKMLRLDGWNVLEQRTSKFVKALRDGFAKKDLSIQIDHSASLFWIHGHSAEVIRTIEQIPQNQAATFKSLFLRSLDKGVYLAPNAYEVGFVSMAHTDELLQQAAQIIIESAV
jgi:glutamate-1-semialdehyde 2,1-aminomutase